MNDIKKDFVEYFKNNNITFKGKDITEIFPEVLKPERKKIHVEIEYDYKGTGYDLGTYIRNNNIFPFGMYNDDNLKVTELPEVFTREDINTMFPSTHMTANARIDKFLSERKSK